MKILILGATGMLGNALFNWFNLQRLDVWGTLRHRSALQYFPKEAHQRLFSDINVDEVDSLLSLFINTQPDVVVNCIGLIKQLLTAKNTLNILTVNALFPHRLAQICKMNNSRLIHFSTDCVFSGNKGMYKESDNPDALDLYGTSKYMGEIIDLPHVITIRTSIIGHEVGNCHSLVEWFLSQTDMIKGYSKAIFSGLPAIEHAHIINDYILPNPLLSGLYHVAAKPINKYELLKLIAKQYQKAIQITPDETIKIDRSLDANKFNNATGYIAPEWPTLIEKMYKFN